MRSVRADAVIALTGGFFVFSGFEGLCLFSFWGMWGTKKAAAGPLAYPPGVGYLKSGTAIPAAVDKYRYIGG